MRRKPIRWALAIGVLLLAALVLACRGSGGEELSVEEVYARFTEAITRPGYVYHAVAEFNREAGPFSGSGTIEHWVDVERGLARQEDAVTFGDGNTIRSQSIVAGGALYRAAQEDQPSSKLEAPQCHGATAAVSSAIGCPGPTEKSTKTVETGRFEGQDAIVIVTTGTSYGSDETFTFTNRLYLDQETFLPIALESEGTMDYGEIYPMRGLSRYQNDFLPVDSLPQNFFDPASIGYVERDPEEPLRAEDPGITVYWLGRDYAGSGGLPPLTLAIAYVQPQPSPAYRLSLEYKLAGDEFGTPALALQEWDAAEWDAFLAQSRGGNWWEWPCREKKDLTIDGRRAVVYMGFDDKPDTMPAIVPTEPADVSCPDRPYDRFITHVYLDSTVVTMRAGQVCSRQECAESPYDTLEGIEAVVRALQPRQ